MSDEQREQVDLKSFSLVSYILFRLWLMSWSSTVAAMIVATIAPLAFGIYMFRKFKGWTWFESSQGGKAHGKHGA